MLIFLYPQRKVTAGAERMVARYIHPMEWKRKAMPYPQVVETTR